MSDQQRPVPERRANSIDETAKILGISRNGAYQAVKRGELPSIKIGKRLLVPTAALERMLDVGGAHLIQAQSRDDQALAAGRLLPFKNYAA